MHRLKAAQLMSRFEAIDKDGNNQVDVFEIAEAVKCSMEEAQKILEIYDDDGNGYLDREEFERLKQKLIRDQMEKKPDYRKLRKHDSLRAQMSDMKDLVNKVLAIDPAGKRVLKVRERSRTSLKARNSRAHMRLSSKSSAYKE